MRLHHRQGIPGLVNACRHRHGGFKRSLRRLGKRNPFGVKVECFRPLSHPTYLEAADTRISGFAVAPTCIEICEPPNAFHILDYTCLRLLGQRRAQQVEVLEPPAQEATSLRTGFRICIIWAAGDPPMREDTMSSATFHVLACIS